MNNIRTQIYELFGANSGISNETLEKFVELVMQAYKDGMIVAFSNQATSSLLDTRKQAHEIRKKYMDLDMTAN